MNIERKKLARIGAGALIVVIALMAFIIKNSSTGKDISVTDKTEMTASGVSQSRDAKELTPEAEPDLETATAPEVQIVVDVAGAVVSPGVITLRQESRVYEAVNQAGGLCQDADTDYINMAALLVDGEKIYIPRKGEYLRRTSESPEAEGTGAQSSAGGGFTESYQLSLQAQSGKININTATSDQLQSLTGIGPSIAQKIIDYRLTNGKFKQTEDIKKVSGIGEKTFIKFKDKITV